MPPQALGEMDEKKKAGGTEKTARRRGGGAEGPMNNGGKFRDKKWTGDIGS